MKNEGWIKLHRMSIENPVFQKPLVWHYFQYCLLKANHEDKKIIWNKKEFIVNRGSFITGRKVASKETGLSQQNIRTSIEVLHNLGMIEKSTSKSTSKFTYITVCNYDTYQDNNCNTNQIINQQLTSNQPATNQQLTTNKNDKNDKNDKNYIIAQNNKKILFCAESNKLTGYDQYVPKWKETYPALDIKYQISKMETWLMEHPKNRKSNYLRFMGNWLRKAQDSALPIKKKECFPL